MIAFLLTFYLQIYRPPTPPINSVSKKQKFPEDSSVDNHEFLTVPRPVSRLLYA